MQQTCEHIETREKSPVVWRPGFGFKQVEHGVDARLRITLGDNGFRGLFQSADDMGSRMMVLAREDDGAKSLRVVSRKVLWLILLQQADRHQNLRFNLVLGSGWLPFTTLDVWRFEVFEQRLEEFIELNPVLPNIISTTDESLQLAESVHLKCPCPDSGNATIEDTAH